MRGGAVSSAGGVLDECVTSTDCADGLTCFADKHLFGCNFGGCCTEYCDGDEDCSVTENDCTIFSGGMGWCILGQ